VIYEVRRGALTRPTTWRLEDDALVEDGLRARRYGLTDLKLARLTTGAGRFADGEQVLALTFGRRRIAIGSMSYAGLGRRNDQTGAFTPFIRALLASAAVQAPGARFRTAGNVRLGVYGGVLAILGAGLVLVLFATLAAGQYRLGADLGARLSFALIVLLTPLPWIRSIGGKAFDPLRMDDAWGGRKAHPGLEP